MPISMQGVISPEALKDSKRYGYAKRDTDRQRARIEERLHGYRSLGLEAEPLSLPYVRVRSVTVNSKGQTGEEEVEMSDGEMLNSGEEMTRDESIGLPESEQSGFGDNEGGGMEMGNDEDDMMRDGSMGYPESEESGFRDSEGGGMQIGNADDESIGFGEPDDMGFDMGFGDSEGVDMGRHVESANLMVTDPNSDGKQAAVSTESQPENVHVQEEDVNPSGSGTESPFTRFQTPVRQMIHTPPATPLSFSGTSSVVARRSQPFITESPVASFMSTVRANTSVPRDVITTICDVADVKQMLMHKYCFHLAKQKLAGNEELHVVRSLPLARLVPVRRMAAMAEVRKRNAQVLSLIFER
jgi:hypothetical protein